MEAGCRNNFQAHSRMEQLEHYGLDLFEEVLEPTLKGFEALSDDQKGLVYDSLRFGVRVACTALGETGSYEQEYQRIVYELRGQG